MKKTLFALLFAALLAVAPTVVPTFAHADTVPAAEEVLSVGQETAVCPMPEIVPPATVHSGSQSGALEAYQMLEQAFDYAYGAYPDHYSGCWLDGGELHVGVTTDDEGTLSVYRDILAPAQCTVVYDVQPYGYNQLMKLHDAISDRLAEHEAYALSSWGVDTSDCRIMVTSRIGYTDELYHALAALVGELGMEEDAFYLEESAWIIVPQTGDGTVIEEHIIETPAVEEVVEEVVVEEILAMSVSVSENPLLPYFNETYGTVPDWYAGCWRDGNGNLHIALTEDADDAMIEECRAVCGDDVVFETHKYSHSQLEAYKTEALERGRGMGMLVSGGIDGYANQAELCVTPSYAKNIPAELTDMLDSLADKMGLGRNVYILAVPLEADEPAAEVVTADRAEPDRAPQTADPSTVLALLLSVSSLAGIGILKKK
ncbi:MAG: hypothetical protein IJC71_02250 [Clostridia bacterium]|nr:hypothetical protein [Clostridia bacterium]